MMLLGLSLQEAKQILDEQGIAYRVVPYYSKKPYEHADTQKVVRVTMEEGTCELVVCSFVTELS